jgi:hypothetical protein
MAALPVDDTLRPRPLGVVAERRDVPGPHGPVDLVDELLVNLVVGLKGEVAAVQNEDPRLRVEEEFRHLGRRRLLDHGGVVKSRREGYDILIGDGRRSSNLPVP